MLCAAQFWQDFLANFLSDLLAGALIGTALGFWISRTLQTRREEKDQLTREAKVKALVIEELRISQRWFEDYLTDDGKLDASYLRNLSWAQIAAAAFPDALWTVLLSGGELSCIRDLDALDTLSRAYYAIHLVNRLMDAALVSDSKQRDIYINKVFPDLAAVAQAKVNEAVAIL